MNNWFLNNFWIKIVSLILAVITWFYVNEELIKEKQMTKQLYKSSVISSRIDLCSLAEFTLSEANVLVP